ncbi:WG repeat-containing protein [Paenibacillus sp. TAB 01]|uniref:WG repeat-containing protein n=1 Tax=Paenibacillus sp. TAB 01 TaxID=3368988 RepID=UPI0037512C95
MLANTMHLKELVTAHLPQGAVLATIERPQPHPALIAADLNGNGGGVAASVYKANDGSLRLLVLRRHGSDWVKVADTAGPGYQVSLLTFAPVLQAGRNNLVVGWRLGAIWSKLSVYGWTHEGIRDFAPEDMNYSYIEIEDMPGPAGKDGQAELALWIHDTGEAFRVEIVRWKDGAFTAAPDVYPYYFPRVVRYYERLTREHPDYAFYWYYLADAQLKAGRPADALVSVQKAISLNLSYPSKEMLLALQNQIEQQLHPRWRRQPDLFPASVKTTHDDQWGYINSKGQMVIPPQYEYANDFQANGFAVVQSRGHSGLIDARGKYVVQPIYDSITPFSEGRAVVIDGQGFKLMDESGRIVTKKPYSYISTLHEGRAMFYVMSGGGNSLYGYLDKQGNEVISAQYLEATDFANGKAVVKVKDGEYALIGLNGQRLAVYPYAFVGPLGDGLLAFQKETNGKYGYLDEKGKVAIAPAFTGAMAFQDGRAVVNTAEDYGSRYGLINRSGAFVIQPGYNEIRQLGDRRVALGKAIDPEQPFIGSSLAIASDEGRQLTDYLYNDVEDFHNGLASVSDSKQTFFIDRSGKAANGYPKVNGSGTLTLTGSIIQANVDRRLSYLDRSGRVIWRQNTVIPLRPPYKVREEKYKPNKDYLVYYPQVEGMANQNAQQEVNRKLKVMSQVKPVPGNVQLTYSYTGDFDVTFFRKDLLVLELNGYNFPFGAAHGMPTKEYAHINLVNGAMYQLHDLFKPGSHYTAVLSDIVGRQIKEDPQYSYVFPDTYKGISADQPFYVTEQALHLYFQPYDIAPYAAGFPTFTIPFKDIMNIIAVDGDFWKSFH